MYLVATPIGNLADLSLRALHLLSLVDAIACEDTRHSQGLLSAYGLHKPLLALHQHNEAQAAQSLIERLRTGQRLAYISDAGTPAISDPGARLVAEVRAAGFAVVPLPGASSVTTALSAAGDCGGDGSFVFWGFLPSKTKARASAVAALACEPRTVVLLEAPHRISASAQALAALGQRPVTLARELSKQHEQIATVAAQDLCAWLVAEPGRERGEFVLVLHSSQAQASASPEQALAERLLRLALAEMPLNRAVALTVAATGVPRNALYARALQMQAEQAEKS